MPATAWMNAFLRNNSFTDVPVGVTFARRDPQHRINPKAGSLQERGRAAPDRQAFGPAPASGDLDRAMSGYRFDRLKVLVVDDNPHMRALIVAVLQAFDIKNIHEASTGEGAWNVLQASPCDIVFLDWVMPGISGLELTKRIRTLPNSPNPFVPIIMLTGHTSLEHVRAARDAGVNEFLAKPVSAKNIVARMMSIIEHPRPFVRTKVYFGPCRRRRPDSDYRGPDRRAKEEDLADLDSPAKASAA
jgi:two-component system, chemotaxis family, chemotaxis protein CheY